MIEKNSFDGSLQTQGAFFKKANYPAVREQIGTAIKKYLDPEQKKVRESFCKERTCLVCRSGKYQVLFYKNCFPHVRCSDCGFTYVRLVLKEEELVAYYSNVQGSWADITENKEYAEIESRYYHFHLDNIEKLIQSKNRSILDVGCNNGEFLSVAKARGWKVYGQELNHYAVEKARKKGFEIVDREFCAEEFKGKKFGAITFLGVLEHVAHPDDFVNTAGKLLEDGGVLGALVPNIDAIATRVLHEKCNTFDGMNHINFWNKTTLERFLKRFGFKLAHAETTISELYTLNNFLNFDHPYCPEGTHALLLDFLTPKYIHQNFMGHHLCGYALPIREGAV